MWPFKKKKTYLIKWNYGIGDIPEAELIKGYDYADAWRRLKKEHSLAISLVSIAEVR